MMKKSEITAYELARSAGDLYCLAIALDKYVFDNVSSVADVTVDSLGGLNGIVKAILLMAEKHSSDVCEFDTSEVRK